tara:strand:+ start:124 stop:537 length:414 start_codon:yes stop_codon:yes gene_type:complete
MANFAKIGLNNKVIQVLSVHNNVLLDSNNVSSENLGIDFLTNLTGWAIWKQSFKDGTRKNQAGIGMTYDEDRDAFIAPKPYASWILNETTCLWEAPVAYPNTQTQNLIDRDGNPTNDVYNWNEINQNWDITEAYERN